MPILRYFLAPTVGTPTAVVAPRRRVRNMLQEGFYAQQAPPQPFQSQQQSQQQALQEPEPSSPEEQKQARYKEFINQPVTGNYIQEQLAKYAGRSAPPELQPGQRVRSANSELVQPSNFQSYYESLDLIGRSGQEQLNAANAQAAHRRLAALKPVTNNNDGGGGGDASPNQLQFSGGGNVASWIDQAANILNGIGIGLSQADKNAISIMIQHESGGNPNAINNWDSNAAAGIPSKGLMQTIDPTFNSHKLAGYNDIYNPVHNIIAGVRYAINRYGSISNVPGIRNLNSGRGYVGY